MIFKRDNFLENYLSKNCFSTHQKKSLSKLKKLKEPFFLTYVNKKKLSKIEIKKYNCKFISKLLIFCKNFKKKQFVKNDCRLAKNLDKKKIYKLVLIAKTQSRFFLDNNIEKKKIKNFRSDWMLKYFKNKKNKKLIVCEIKKKIKGILLISSDKKICRIDMILVHPSFIRRNIASSLISFANNYYINQKNYLIAGTQQSNVSAIKFYKKNNFKLIDFKYYHHIYSI